MKELGKRIKRRRLSLGLTQVDVAAAAGKSHAWLHAIESGQGNPPAEALVALAIKLGEDPREYLRLAGRVALRAEDVTPVTRPEVPPALAEAIAEAVAVEMRPLLDRIDQLVALLEADRGGR